MLKMGLCQSSLANFGGGKNKFGLEDLKSVSRF